MFVPAPSIRVRLTACFFALPGSSKMTSSSFKSLVPWYSRDIQSLSRRALTKLLMTSCQILVNHERQTAQTLIKGLHNLLEGLIWTHTGPHRKCDQNCLADFITCFRKVQLWPIHENTSKPAGNILSDLKDAFNDPLSSLVCKASGTSTYIYFE